MPRPLPRSQDGIYAIAMRQTTWTTSGGYPQFKISAIKLITLTTPSRSRSVRQQSSLVPQSMINWTRSGTISER